MADKDEIKSCEILMDELPKRTLNTMSDAIGLSSPSGHMSARSKKASTKRLCVALFGEKGLQHPQIKQETRKENLLRRARQLRELAARGMKPRAYKKEAERLEREAMES